MAISYLDRGDLVHVHPSDLMPDTVGKGEADSNLRRRAASNGLVRSKLTVLDGGAGRATALADFASPDIDKAGTGSFDAGIPQIFWRVPSPFSVLVR